MSLPFHANRELAVNVPDLAAARAFYGDVLGFPLRHECDKCLEFDAGALRLFVNRKPELPGVVVPSLDVSDLASAREALVRAGCTIVVEGKDGFWFRDPFGAVMDVIQRN